MADILLNGEFWLPPEFFSDDEPEEPETIQRNPNMTLPFDFPANFDSNSSSLSSSAFSSPVESATETESDEEDETLTGLTRSFTQLGLRANQKQRSWPLSASSQSPLSDGEIWSRRKSLPAAVRDGGSWDRSHAAVAVQVSRMKMNGGDEEVFRGRKHVDPPMGPKLEQLFAPLGDKMCGYGHQFPYNYAEPEIKNHIQNQSNCCSILGRPFVDDLLQRKIQLQQYILSQHRTKVLSQVQFEENAKFICSPLSLNPYSGSSSLVRHQIDQRRGVSFGGFAPKPACAGTGVFIPRPCSSNVPKKLVAGRSTAHHPPGMYQAVKNVTQTSTQGLATPDQLFGSFPKDNLRTKTMLIQKMPGFQLDGSVNHAQILPREWSY